MADKFYILNISATDHGQPQFTSYAILNITVTDFNDNQPQFSKNSYNLGVSEDAKVDTYFDQITATDEDTGENAKVMHGLYFKEPLSIMDLSGGSLAEWIERWTRDQ